MFAILEDVDRMIIKLIKWVIVIAVLSAVGLFFVYPEYAQNRK